MNCSIKGIEGGGGSENQYPCGDFVHRLCLDVPNQTMKSHEIPCLIEGEIDPGIRHAVEGHQPEQVLHLVLCKHDNPLF